MVRAKTGAGAWRRRIFAAAAAALGTLVAAALALLLVHFEWVHSNWYRAQLVEWQQHTAARKRIRVALIGDSFLAHWPQRRSLGHDLLRWCRQHNIGCITAATPGTGPVEYLARVKLLATELRPDLFLLFYHVGNDLTDVMHHRPLAPGQSPQPQDLKPDSRQWQIMRQRGVSDDIIHRAKNTLEEPTAFGDEMVNPWLLNIALERPALVRRNLLMDTPKARQAWQRTRGLMGQMFNVARTRGVPIYVVIIPSTVQVSSGGAAFIKRIGFQVQPGMLTGDLPQQKLRRLCEQHKVPYLDLLPHFRRSPLRDSLYWQRDDHFSQQGHVLATELVLQRLVRPWLARVVARLASSR